MTVLQRGEHELAVGREDQVAGRIGHLDLPHRPEALGRAFTLDRIDVHPVEPQRRGDKPLAVRRVAELIRIGNVAHAALNLATDRVEKVQVVADRVAHDQRLAVGRAHQVVRFLAHREALDLLARGRIDQADARLTRIQHHDHVGTRRRSEHRHAESDRREGAAYRARLPEGHANPQDQRFVEF